ncbi:sensor histidine kinase [Streptomyces sp. NPDC050264]|uniref:sensor histidine kinase n=1 Tax=Streptomyces sp. NPDC050264 TaxID=3155038 RepID=UPI003425703F
MLKQLQRYLGTHPRTAEAGAITVAFGLAVYASAEGTWGTTPDQLAWWPGVTLSALACVALWWRRSHPLAVALIVALCVGPEVIYGYLTTPILLAPAMLALYWLAIEGDRKTAHVYGLVLVVLVVPPSVLGDNFGNAVLAALNPAFFLFLPVAWGSALQARRAYLGSLRTRAELAERTREEEARRRVEEERVRIARELHDVVAHHLALANAQAGTAAHLVRRKPEQAESLIKDLAGTTASALRELKATVGLLRRPGEQGSSTEPSPGLGRLPELIDEHAAMGLSVTVTSEGEERPLAPGVDLTAYRIVQEALTNVRKHALTEAAQVELSYTGNLLTITVSDDGTGGKVAPAEDTSGGYGLIGMRERAHSAGGRFAAGHRPGGGFTVTAELPVNF